MGSVSDRRKRINAALPRPVTGPIPGSAIRARLIDLADLTKERDCPFGFCDDSRRTGFDRSSGEPVYHLLSGSGADKFYLVTSANQTMTVFNSIGTSLWKLRVAK